MSSAFGVCVIGGGAAGMLAALYAAMGGASVALIERNEKLGKKVYITGKGRCNLTNASGAEAFFQNTVRNPRFPRSALSFLSPEGMVALIERLGVPTKVERGGRVFPLSDKSSDVTRALEGALRRAGVRIFLNSRVKSLIIEDARARGALLEDGREVRAERVIIAAGGASYPATGSTGDGYGLAAQAGHTCLRPLPALTPIETCEDWPFSLSGLTLKNVALAGFDQAGKRVWREQGELLFTHFGLSGPLALSLSSYLPEEARGCRMEIDLKPALDSATLDKRLTRDFAASPNKALITVLEGLEPRALAAELVRLAGLPEKKSVNAVTQAERRALCALIKRVPLTVKRLRGLEEAIITRGGVNVKEVNPSTLESRKTPGLYIAGEALDVDALTGGYNLQLAFSTGALAGASAAESLSRDA